jgi:ABC-type lipoprotein release transport system permease subunit
MRVAWAYGRLALRAHWRGLLLAAAMGVLGVGFSLLSLEGERRADTAYERLREETLGFDALLDATGFTDADVASLATEPGVLAAARFSYTPVAPEPLVPGVDAGAFVGLDDTFLRSVYRPLVIDGRLPEPGATDEVLVNEPLAERGGLHAGDRVTLTAGFEQAERLGVATVVGISRGAFDVGANAGNPSMLLPRSFLEAHGDRMQVGDGPALLVRLEDAANLASLEGLVAARTGQPAVALSAEEEARAVERSLSVQATAFSLLALVAALAAMVAVGQALARTVQSALHDLPTLVALGWAPRARSVIGLVLAAPVALVGVVGGVAVAALVSPAVPTGLARDVDPVSGIHLFPVLVGAVAGATVVLVLSMGALLAWRRPPTTASAGRVPRVDRVLEGLPLRARLGARLALAPMQAPAGAAARSALIAAAIATAGVVGVVVFATSLGELVDPAHADRHGWSFDVAVSTDGDLEEIEVQAREAAGEGAAVSVAQLVYLEVAGEPVESYAFPDAGPEVHPTLRSGRVPGSDREIVLGADTARAAGVGVGDHVEVAGGSRALDVTVVGIATFPELGNNGDLGNAASLTAALATALDLPAEGGAALVRLGEDPPSDALDRLGGLGELVTPFEAPRLRQLEEVGALPALLAVFLAVLGAAAIAHSLLRVIGGRRQELSVLRCVGFRPADVRFTIACQAATTAVVGGAAGLVAGLIAGRAAWAYVADRTAVVVHVDVPVLLTASVVPAAIGVALLLASGAAWRAGRRSPADGLQPE